MAIEVVTPGSADDPFAAGTSDADQTGASTSGVPAVPASEGQPVEDQTTAQTPPPQTGQQAAAADDGAGDSDELTTEEQEALDLYFQHRLETEALPKIQSSVDRRMSAAQSELRRVQAQSAEQLKQLQNELREVKLHGLSEEDQAKIKAQWVAEDRQAELDSYEQQLESYHRDIVVANYITQFPHLELTTEDFADFTTPEQMELFLTLADREYYKELVARGGTPAAPAKPEVATRNAPAGATAPSAGDAGGAPPTAPKFNATPGRQAMIENIGDGWESVQIAR